MTIVIVPVYVSDAIYEKIDIELELHPDAGADRDVFYSQLLNYYNEHGIIPDFSLEKK